MDTPQDVDADLVAQAQGGKLAAFEELVGRHTQLIYRTLMAMLGNAADAQDGLQDTLLRVFKHIGGFQGRSKFSTWLVSIARNTALQRLRGRKNVESLDEHDCEEGGDFRPRQARALRHFPEPEFVTILNRRLLLSWLAGPSQIKSSAQLYRSSVISLLGALSFE